MKTAIFLKMDKVKQIKNNFSFPNGTNKSIANFRETIPTRMLFLICFFEKLKPSRSKIRQIWRTSFYIDGCFTLRTEALRLQI
jgi:hypothetical protein